MATVDKISSDPGMMRGGGGGGRWAEKGGMHQKLLPDDKTD